MSTTATTATVCPTEGFAATLRRIAVLAVRHGAYLRSQVPSTVLAVDVSPIGYVIATWTCHRTAYRLAYWPGDASPIAYPLNAEETAR